MAKEDIIARALRKAEISDKKRKQVLGEIKESLEKEKSLKASIKEGGYASVMSGFTNDYITPYALTLNASTSQIGFLSSFAALFSPLSQILGSRLMEKYSRKKLLITFVSLHALMLLPIIFLALFSWQNLFSSYLPIILIMFYSLYAIFGSIAGPAWFSLLGDLVPEKIRGKYFGKRNKICGSIALASTFIAAFILDFFKTRGLVLLGFSCLFLIACIARLISAYLFKKHYEPKLELDKSYYFSFWQFIKKAPSNNFGRFVIFVAITHFTVSIAGPFFAVYMLKELNFSYSTFMLVNLAAAVTSLLFMPVWGRFSDKYGNRELMRIGNILLPFVPLLWTLSKSPTYLILIPQIISGLGWSAFNLSASNFIYDSVSPQRRGICVAYYNVLNGLGVFVGASLGGLLIQYLPITFISKFLFIFIISGILRATISFISFKSIKEIKKVEKHAGFFFYIKEPVRGFMLETSRDFISLKSRFRKTTKRFS